MNSKNTYKTFGNLIRSFIPLVMLSPAPIFAAANVEPKCTVDVIAPDFLCINKDDDHKTEKWDKDDPTPFMMADDDLKSGSVTFSVPGDFNGTLTVTFKEGGDKVGGKAWEDAKKTKVHVLKWKIKDGAVEEGEPPLTFFLEGVKHSDKVDDVVMKAVLAGAVGGGGEGEGGGEESESKPCGSEDESETTVYEVDADVDSLNDSQFNFSFTDAEDKIEASEKLTAGKKKPGKYIFVNAGFSANDNDARPGWADGIDVGGASGTPIDFKFTPIQITLKEPFDPAKAKIKFEYSGSDPAAVTRAAGGGTPSEKFTYTLGSSGKLRIWKKDFTDTRDEKGVDAGGDYVLDGTEFEWSKIASGKVAKLYIEAVRPSGSLGDQKIKVIVTEEGATCEDKVHVTAVYFEKPVLTVTANAAAGYAIVNNRLTATNGPAVSYEVSVELVPDDVDCSVSPIANKRAAIMQNVVSDTKDYELHNPQLPGAALVAPAAWPAPGFVDVPVSGTATFNPFPPRVNDSIDWSAGAPAGIPAGLRRDWTPIYAVLDPIPAAGTAMGDILGRPLDCNPPGKSTKSNDTPGDGFVKQIIFELGAPATPVLVVNYTVKRIQQDLNFVTWCAGYNVDTKRFYPLKETTWELDLDTDVAGQQGAMVAAAQVNPTMVPVRTPLANVEAQAQTTPPNGINIVPDPGAVTSRVP